jgi:hypothetical protein
MPNSIEHSLFHQRNIYDWHTIQNDLPRTKCFGDYATPYQYWSFIRSCPGQLSLRVATTLPVYGMTSDSVLEELLSLP